jgi:competence protein ComEA
MPEISRSQLFVYGAVAVALLFVGARAIRVESGGTAPPVAEAASTADGGGRISFSSSGGSLVVDVAGAVRSPGVYSLPEGARVKDAIARAGGPSDGALLEAINRAARVADGQQVVVPEAGPGGAPLGITGVASEDGPIGLGTATVEQLDTIEGIGPVTAQSILDFRDENGGLSSVDQLDEISGIGPATMDALRSRLQP